VGWSLLELFGIGHPWNPHEDYYISKFENLGGPLFFMAGSYHCFKEIIARPALSLTFLFGRFSYTIASFMLGGNCRHHWFAYLCDRRNTFHYCGMVYAVRYMQRIFQANYYLDILKKEFIITNKSLRAVRNKKAHSS